MERICAGRHKSGPLAGRNSKLDHIVMGRARPLNRAGQSVKSGDSIGGSIVISVKSVNLVSLSEQVASADRTVRPPSSGLSVRGSLVRQAGQLKRNTRTSGQLLDNFGTKQTTNSSMKTY